MQICGSMFCLFVFLVPDPVRHLLHPSSGRGCEFFQVRVTAALPGIRRGSQPVNALHGGDYMTAPLFDKSEFVPEPAAEEPSKKGPPRLRLAVRDQIVMHWEAVDDLIPEDHRARMVWAYVEGLDLSPLLEKFDAVEGAVGRAGTDPRILLTLWLYATIEGVGNARELDRLCKLHAAYKWICGGVSLNYRALSDFRVQHEAFLDELLTRSITAILKSGVVELKRVAQDGLRSRLRRKQFVPSPADLGTAVGGGPPAGGSPEGRTRRGSSRRTSAAEGRAATGG